VAGLPARHLPPGRVPTSTEKAPRASGSVARSARPIGRFSENRQRPGRIKSLEGEIGVRGAEGQDKTKEGERRERHATKNHEAVFQKHGPFKK